MKLNKKEYKILKLDFNAMCKMEDMRVNLMQMDNKMFLLIRGLLALAMNTDIETSGKELEAHIINGGSLNETMENSTGKISKPLNKLTLPTFEIKMSYYSVGEVMRSALD